MDKGRSGDRSSESREDFARQVTVKVFSAKARFRYARSKMQSAVELGRIRPSEQLLLAEQEVDQRLAEIEHSLDRVRHPSSEDWRIDKREIEIIWHNLRRSVDTFVARFS